MPYGKIILDGNVHLIGNQGVGKSTVLRAILFFYNANTQRLGISRNKKGFKEYYFSFPNSHLIYEVQTQNSAYCVWIFKSKNQITYRFIDKAYDRNFFIDELNIARTHKAIERELDRLGVAYTSKMINNFSDYRDIIYGKAATKFRKYALFQSKIYDNIPRTISNIFLNSKLEGKFIKNTIISSIVNNENAMEVDLDVVRSQVANFQKNYQEILSFKKHEQKGQRIIDIYQTYLNERKHYQKTAEKLGIAVEQAKIQLKNFESKLQGFQNDKSMHLEKLKTLQANYRDITKTIEDEIAILNNDLQKTDKLILKYQLLDIEKILTLNSQKSTVQSNLKRAEQELEQLTNEFQDVVKQYKILFENVAAAKRELEAQHKANLSDLRTKWLELKDENTTQKNIALAKLNKDFDAKLRVVMLDVEVTKDRFREANFELKSIQSKVFLSQEKQDIQNQQSDLKEEKYRIATKLQQLENSLLNYKKDAEQERNKLNQQIDNQRKAFQKTLSDLNQNLRIIQQNIEQYEHTIYGFLDKKYPNWRDTIGKVFNDDILLSTDLNPQFQKGDNTFFGLTIDLNTLPQGAKQHDDFIKQEQDLNTQKAQLHQQIQALNTKSIDDKKALETKHNKKIRGFERSIKLQKQALDQNTRTFNRLKVELNDIDEQAKTLKKQAITAQKEVLKTTKQKVNLAKETLNNVQTEKQNTQTALQKQFDDILNAQKIEYEQEVSKLKSEYKNTLQSFEEERQQLADAQQKMLTEKGAETTRIGAINIKITSLKKQLKTIENNQETVITYKQDKANYIDKKSTFEYDYQRLRNELNDKRKAFEIQKKDIERVINGIDAKIDQLKEQQLFLMNELKNFKRTFSSLETSVKTWISKPSKQWKVKQSVADLMFKIQEIERILNKHQEELKKKINQFKSYFEEGNQFDLPIHISGTSEYLDFAKRLENLFDNSMVTTFEAQIEKQFSMLIGSIQQKTKALDEIKYKVDNVVRQINRNFGERNFVEAIEDIKLRTSESKRAIVKKLLNIQRFYDENALSTHGLGGLFSTVQQQDYSQKAVDLLKQLVIEIGKTTDKKIGLEDAFELEFRIIENKNTTDWVANLSNVGSNGTDVLVKAMIYIMLLNTFKNNASRKNDTFKIHCIIDEVGILHDINLEGLINFANHHNIILINGSPNASDTNAYRYIYQLSKNQKRETLINLLMIDNRKA